MHRDEFASQLNQSSDAVKKKESSAYKSWVIFAYMCVKHQMRLYVCQALPPSNTKCVCMCVTQCVC